MATPADPLRGQNDDERDVTASEIAAYAYCAKAWHLERVVGAAASPAAARRRAAGVGRHEAHGARVARLRTLGPALVGAAALLIALALVLGALVVLRR